MIFWTYRENAFRPLHGLLHGLLVAQVSCDDLGALFRQRPGGLRFNVASDGAGLERRLRWVSFLSIGSMSVSAGGGEGG